MVLDVNKIQCGYTPIKNNEIIANHCDNDCMTHLERSPRKDIVEFTSIENKTENQIFENVPYTVLKNDLRSGVAYSRKSDWLGNYTMDAVNEKVPDNELHLKVNNDFWGRSIKGTMGNNDIDLKITTSMFNFANGKVKGKINDKDVDLEFSEDSARNGIDIKGTLHDANFIPLISLSVGDKIADMFADSGFIR